MLNKYGGVLIGVCAGLTTVGLKTILFSKESKYTDSYLTEQIQKLKKDTNSSFLFIPTLQICSMNKDKQEMNTLLHISGTTIVQDIKVGKQIPDIFFSQKWYLPDLDNIKDTRKYVYDTVDMVKDVDERWSESSMILKSYGPIKRCKYSYILYDFTNPNIMVSKEVQRYSHLHTNIKWWGIDKNWFSLGKMENIVWSPSMISRKEDYI